MGAARHEPTASRAPRGCSPCSWGGGIAFAALLGAVPSSALATEPASQQQAAAPAEPKEETPTVDKQVGEVGPDGSVSWQKAADAEAGAWTPYRLTGTLPSAYDEYETYHYAFVDQLDPELEADPASVTVELLAADGTPQRDVTSAFTVAYANHTLTATAADLKAAVPDANASSKLRVSYNARLVAGAAAPGTADPADNYVYVEYTAKPDADGLGKTPESRARLLTWSLVLDKVAAGTSTRLSGARFTLAAERGGYVQADGTLGPDAHEFVTGEDGIASVAGLDDGTYTLTETAAPDGYAQLDKPVTLTLTSRLDQDSAAIGATEDSSAAEVTASDAGSGAVTLQVSNDRPGLPKVLPQTGVTDGAALALLVGAAGATAVAVGRRARGSER